VTVLPRHQRRLCVPASLSVEPNLVPKLRIVLADFPYLHSETGRQEAAEPRRPDAVPRYVLGVLCVCVQRLTKDKSCGSAPCPSRDFQGPWCAAARRHGGVDVACGNAQGSSVHATENASWIRGDLNGIGQSSEGAQPRRLSGATFKRLPAHATLTNQGTEIRDRFPFAQRALRLGTTHPRTCAVKRGNLLPRLPSKPRSVYAYATTSDDMPEPELLKETTTDHLR